MNWDRSCYLGMNIDWDCTNEEVHVSMLDTPAPSKTTTPAVHSHQTVYSTSKQYAEDSNTSPSLDKMGKKYMQEVLGSLLYYT
jgi:hypothetical protein